jgi:hypothetical protein
MVETMPSGKKENIGHLQSRTNEKWRVASSAAVSNSTKSINKEANVLANHW